MQNLIPGAPGRPTPQGARRHAASRLTVAASCCTVWLALATGPALAQENPRLPLREPELAKQPAPEVDTEKEAYAKLPPCKLSDDGKHLAEEPCRTAKALEPMPRRPVPQAVERVSPAAQAEPTEPVPPRPPTSPRGPDGASPAVRPGASLSPPVLPATPPRSVTPAPPLVRPGAPIPTAGCDAGGCYGPNGQRYNNGPGATVVSPSGKLCTRNGAWIQC